MLPQPAMYANIPQGTSQVMSTAIHHKFQVDREMYATQERVKEELSHLIQQVCGIHLQELEHDQRGYEGILPARMMAHLFATYATMSGKAVRANEQILDEPFDFHSQVMQTFIKRQKNVRDIAQQHDPISDYKMVNASLQVLEQSGHFTEAILAWENSQAQKTYNTFTSHFNKAFNKFCTTDEYKRHHNPTAAQNGHANSATTGNTSRTGATTCNLSSDEERQLLLLLNRLGKYCHTHGWRYNDNGGHSSKECTSKGPNHDDNATLLHPCGGHIRMFKPQGYVQTYVPNNRNNNRRGNDNGNGNGTRTNS